MSLSLDINNFLTNSETNKSTLFDDIDKFFGNKPFLNNSTNDELFANTELNLLRDPSTVFLNLNSNSNGATNIASTETLSTSHYNVEFPELSLDPIVPTNIIPPSTLQYQQQSHQLTPILSDNYNLYLNHDNNLITKNQLEKCGNQISPHIRKSRTTSDFSTAITESSMQYQHLPRNYHQNSDADSICQPNLTNGIINTNNLSNGIITRNNLSNGIITPNDLSNGLLTPNNLSNSLITTNNLSNGQVHLNHFTPNCFNLPAQHNIHPNVINTESNHYNIQNTNLNISNQNIQLKPPPKFINTFKPLIEPLQNQNNSSVAKLIAGSSQIDDQSDINNIETLKTQLLVPFTTKNEENNETEQSNSNKNINKKNVTKTKKEEIVTLQNKTHKSQTDETDGLIFNSNKNHQNVPKANNEKESIQTFIEQFRADKDLTLITTEPSYQNIAKTANEPVKKNLKRKAKTNNKISKKNKLSVKKNEVINELPFSHNFKNALLESGNLTHNSNLLSFPVINQIQPQASLIKDNAVMFAANDNCNFELYPSDSINLIGSTTNQIDTLMPSLKQHISEFVYPSTTSETMKPEEEAANSIQHNNKINTNSNGLKLNFNGENDSIKINHHQDRLKENENLNEILDTSDLYALLSSNTETALENAPFSQNTVSSIQPTENTEKQCQKGPREITTEIKKISREISQVSKTKKKFIKKKKPENTITSAAPFILIKEDKFQNFENKTTDVKPILNEIVQTSKPKKPPTKTKKLSNINSKSNKTNINNLNCIAINNICSEIVQQPKHENYEGYFTHNTTVTSNSQVQNDNTKNNCPNKDLEQIQNDNIKSGIFRKQPQQVKQIFKASENVYITKSNPSGAVIKMNQFEEIVMDFKNEFSNIINNNEQTFPSQLTFQKSELNNLTGTDNTVKEIMLDDINKKTNIISDDINSIISVPNSFSMNKNVIDVSKNLFTINPVLETRDVNSTQIKNTKLIQKETTILNPKYTPNDKLMILAYDVLKLKNTPFTVNREEMKLEVRDPIAKKSISYRIIQPQDLSLTTKRLSDLLRLTPSKLNKQKKSKINQESLFTSSKPQPIVRTRYGRVLKPTLPNDEIISLKVDKTKKITNNKINSGINNNNFKTLEVPPNNIHTENLTCTDTEKSIEITKNKPAEKSAAVAKYKCQTCNKLFMGKRLQKHYISNPDHNPVIRKSRDIYELSLYKFLVEKIKNSSDNEDNRVELFLNEISDLVEQLQSRSSKLVQSTSGMHLVNAKNCKILGIPEGHYEIDISGIDAIPDPIINEECDPNRLIAPPPVPRLDFSISMDDTITAKLNLSDNCNAPSEESLLRTVNDLVQTDINKLDEKHLHYDQCDNAVEAMPIKINDTPILDLSLLFNNN